MKHLLWNIDFCYAGNTMIIEQIHCHTHPWVAWCHRVANLKCFVGNSCVLIILSKMDQCLKLPQVNVWYNSSIMTKIIVPINPYKIIYNNGHGCYLFKCYYFNLWIIHVQSLTNLHKSIWKLVFNVVDVIF